MHRFWLLQEVHEAPARRTHARRRPLQSAVADAADFLALVPYRCERDRELPLCR